MVLVYSMLGLCLVRSSWGFAKYAGALSSIFGLLLPNVCHHQIYITHPPRPIAVRAPPPRPCTYGYMMKIFSPTFRICLSENIYWVGVQLLARGIWQIFYMGSILKHFIRFRGTAIVKLSCSGTLFVGMYFATNL